MENAEKPIIALGSWLQTPIGQYVLAWEQAQLDALTADIFGFNAVQIGTPDMQTLQANRMPYRWMTDVLLPTREQAQHWLPMVILQDFTELPFASQSLDLIVLPHVLEFAAEPHRILREVERVLIPEGQLIITGFNPASLWGVSRLIKCPAGTDVLPHVGEFISLPRIKDWLKLLNMEVGRGQFGCYAPPCRTEKWLHHFDFMESAGKRWWPYFGAVYIIQAVKRVHGMHLIGPAWDKKRAKSANAVAVTHRVHNSEQSRE
jgi:SAM-dependent methyltransferase